ncbi:MAG TPA: cytochrome c-type biogenesis protein CcmH [Candidatus Acidoferrales bacterium]|nr:cytochrome c-type biogenesis protein CcmH [Candidatus Acidoferrales bacterium]
MISRNRGRRIAWPILAALLALVLAASLAPLASAQQTERAKRLGGRMMCVCGCNQILTACNHVGCTTSHAMLKELDERIARGDSDELVLQSFIQEYGPTVLVDPPKTGFTGLLWVVPIVAPLLALWVVWELVRRWRQRATLSTAGGPQISPELLNRARQDVEKSFHE